MSWRARVRWIAMGAAGLAAVACEDRDRQQPVGPDHPAAGPATTGATAKAAPAAPTASAPAGLRAFDGRWVVEQTDGTELARIEMTREEALIRFGDQQLTGRLRGGARRYVLSGQPGYVAKVKRRGPVIELRDGDNRPRCLAELQGETIRLSLGNDPTVVLHITPRRGGAYALLRETTLLGTVTPEESAKRMVVASAAGVPQFRGAAERPSALWAVLLLDELDEPLRYILMAELGARGR